VATLQWWTTVRSEQKALAREGEYSSGILQEETATRTKKLDALDGFNPMQRRQMGNGLGPAQHRGMEEGVGSSRCYMRGSRPLLRAAWQRGGAASMSPAPVPFFYLLKKSKDLNRFDHKRAFSNSKKMKNMNS
jgi:hypothetical protein